MFNDVDEPQQYSYPVLVSFSSETLGFSLAHRRMLQPGEDEGPIDWRFDGDACRSWSEYAYDE